MAMVADDPLTEELFNATPDYVGEHPTTAGPIKAYLRKLGEKTGIITGYRKLRSLLQDEPLEEPTYLNHPTVLGKYFRPLGRKIKRYFGESMDFAPYFKKLNISVEPLPTFARRFLEIGRGYIREHIVPVGKIFGMYKPETDEIKVDPIVLPEINDPKTSAWRNFLKRYGISNDGERVLVHEMTHYVQKVTGAIGRYLKKAGEYARPYIEGGATDMAEEILGKRQGVYDRETSLFRKLKRNYGRERAFLGHVPANKLRPAYAAA